MRSYALSLCLILLVALSGCPQVDEVVRSPLPAASEIVVEGCNKGGRFYGTGESFPAGDGCNTCSCGVDGRIACTDMICDEPDAVPCGFDCDCPAGYSCEGSSRCPDTCDCESGCPVAELCLWEGDFGTCVPD